jgi:hypothetical protein
MAIYIISTPMRLEKCDVRIVNSGNGYNRLSTPKFANVDLTVHIVSQMEDFYSTLPVTRQDLSSAWWVLVFLMCDYGRHSVAHSGLIRKLISFLL